MLLFARQVIRCGVSAKVLLKATLISGSRLGCCTYGWLTLLEFMVQFMWVVVLSCSARMAFLTPFSMLRISKCWLCLCQNAKFEALQHAPSLVISWLCTSLSNILPGSNWSCCQAPAQSWANIQTGGHRSVWRAHAHTHTHTHTHTLWHIRLAQAWFWRRLLASASHIWAGSSCLFWLNLARLGGDYDSWCRRYDGGMCYLLEVSPVSLVVLAIRLALFFIVTHARARKNTRPVLVATRLGGSQELETRAYFLAEPYWTWWRCLTCMCRLLCLLLVWHCRFIVTCLPPTWLFALPCDMEAGFFFGKTLSDVVAICISWCQWYEEVVHGSIGCRASSAIYLGLYFHCASHAACTHTPFQKLAIALAIGFSSESVLKYERLKHKKRNLSAWWC